MAFQLMGVKIRDNFCDSNAILFNFRHFELSQRNLNCHKNSFRNVTSDEKLHRKDPNIQNIFN